MLGRTGARPESAQGEPRAVPGDTDQRSRRTSAGEDDAQRIYAYARRIGPLDERPERCDPEIRAALTRLGQSAAKAQAIALGGTLASALPQDAELQLAVAELLVAQRDYRPAVPLLQRALGSAQARREERRRARFLLHEAALAADEAAAAVGHLTELLAEDFGYPGARARLATLHERARAGRHAGADSGIAAPRWVEPALPQPTPGGGLTAPAAPTLIGLPSGPDARYQLLGELGCGSSGTVYLALDTELSCEVALKVFYPRDGAATLLRALHEARLLAAVRHPGVIALYDIAGELPDEAGGGASGPPRLAMELCRGGSLRARLHSGPLPVRAALRRGTELFATLAAVHHTGIVHGDLKPENLLFRGPDQHTGDLPPAEAQLGDLVLSDFGLGRLGTHDGEASRGLGTFGYTAPERLSGAQADTAGDIYSAAAVLLEMLCGEFLSTREAQPFRPPLALLPAERWAAVAEKLGPPGPMLRTLLERLLHADPAARPTAAAAIDQLTAVTASLPSELHD